MTQPSHRPSPRIAYLLADAGVKYLDSQKGASIHARSLAGALRAEGAEVEVYALRRGGQKIRGHKAWQAPRSGACECFHRWTAADGFPGRWLARAEPGGEPSRPNWASALGLLLWQRDFLRGVRPELARFRPDLLYARNAWLAWPYARLKRDLGLPLVLEVNAVCTLEKRARGELAFARRTEAVEREAFAAADLILPVTQRLKDEITAFGVAAEKVVVTPNAVDLDLFAPGPSAAAEGGERLFRIGCVHSFKAYHGMEVLLEAARMLRDRIPNLRLRLIGGGEELDRVRAQAEALGIGDRVEFTGTVEHAQVPALLRDCQAGVAPYRGTQNLYGCPMKLYEYMALRLPIVAARWGDIPNIIDAGRTGLLHAEGDAASLAEQLLALREDPDRGRAMADAAYALVRRHSWRSVARDILDWQARHCGRADR